MNINLHVSKEQDPYFQIDEAVDFSSGSITSMVTQLAVNTFKTTSNWISVGRQPHPKDGVFYQCIGESEVEGGKQYKFKFTHSSLFYSERMTNWFWLYVNSDIYPAVEGAPCELRDKCEFLSALGYEYNPGSFEPFTATVTLPDRDLLTYRWNRLREKIGTDKMLALDIISGKGIASDREFIQAFIEHDGILSEGKEFFHDHTAHIMQLLVGMFTLQGELYEIVKRFLVDYFKLLFRKIESSDSPQKEEMITTLSYLIDTTSNKIDRPERALHLLQFLPMFCRAEFKERPNSSKFLEYLINRPEYKEKYHIDYCTSFDEIIDNLEQLIQDWEKLFQDEEVQAFLFHLLFIINNSGCE